MITADQLKDVLDRADALYKYLKIDEKKMEYEEEDLRTQAPDFWEDQKRAEEQMKKVKGIKKWLDGYQDVRTAADELQLAYDFYKEEMVTEEEVDANYAKAIDFIEKLELKNMLRQKEDPMECVLKINSGAGGTEAQDWGAMLLRMYVRWAERHGFVVETANYEAGEEAGIKSVSLLIKGRNAYGMLRSEKGVHRLVRISPFDAAKRRHTSFASVDVMPELDDSVQIDIDPSDLRVDTFRSSGAGGQHINKTESAVRITHLPTGIVVASQAERSQLQNRQTAMSMLKSKLYELEEEKQAKQRAEIEGVQLDIGWGSQIRSYVFQPYTMVKDNRSGYETHDVQGVMDGNLDPFINAYLQWRLSKKNPH